MLLWQVVAQMTTTATGTGVFRLWLFYPDSHCSRTCELFSFLSARRSMQLWMEYRRRVRWTSSFGNFYGINHIAHTRGLPKLRQAWTERCDPLEAGKKILFVRKHIKTHRSCLYVMGTVSRTANSKEKRRTTTWVWLNAKHLKGNRANRYE